MKVINPIDKLVTEWSWRCRKGYPDLNNTEDMAILKNILLEYNITLEKVEEKLEEIDNYEFINNIPLPQDDLAKIIEVFENLGNKDKQIVKNNFRNHSIESFSKLMKTDYNSYKPFFFISSKKGRGHGEFIPLLCIKDSKSGGTEDKDIIIGDTILEIKELDKGNLFLTGKSGSVKKSMFSINIETYCRYIDQLGIEEGENESIDFITKYFHNQFISGNVSNQFIAAIKDSVEFIRELSPKDLQDMSSTSYVKIGDKRFEFSLEPGKEINSGEIIKLGKELQQQEVALRKINKHPIFKNPDIIYDNYLEAVDRYLGTIDYFGIFPLGGSTAPRILTSSELKNNIKENYISIIQHNLRIILSSSS